MASSAPADSMSDPNKSQIFLSFLVPNSLSIIPHNITLAETKRKEETKWTGSDEKKLVTALKEAKLDGLQADSGFKPNAWTAVVTALKGSEITSGGSEKTVATCKSRWQRVSKYYSIHAMLHF